MHTGILSAAVGYVAYWMINTPKGRATADKIGEHLLKQMKISKGKLTTAIQKGNKNESDVRNDSAPGV